VDALDPTLISSTGTRVPNGLFPHDVESIFEEALFHDKLVSCDITEFNEKLGDPAESIKHLKKVFERALPKETKRMA